MVACAVNKCLSCNPSAYSALSNFGPQRLVFAQARRRAACGAQCGCRAVLIKGLTNPCSAICRDRRRRQSSDCGGRRTWLALRHRRSFAARGIDCEILCGLGDSLRWQLAAKHHDNVQGPDSVETCRRFVSPVQPCPGLLGLFLASWVFMWAARMHAK